MGDFDDVDDTEMFDAAVGGEEVKQEPTVPEQTTAPETPAQETSPEESGQARDPATGQFVSRQEPETAPENEPPKPSEAAPQQQTPEPAQAQAEPGEGEPQGEGEPKGQGQVPEGFVPSWRQAEEAARRREAEAENAQLRTLVQSLQAQQQQPTNAPQQGEAVNPWDNPEGFGQNLEQNIMGRVNQALQQTTLSNSLALAQHRHGAEVFGPAYENLVSAAQRGDRASYVRVMNSPDPGEAIVQWDKEQKLIKETGGDPNAYRQKIADELKADPEFRKQVIEALRAEAQGNPNGQTPANTVTQVPPSLSSLPGGGGSPHPEGAPQTAYSEEALFNQALG